MLKTQILLLSGIILLSACGTNAVLPASSLLNGVAVKITDDDTKTDSRYTQATNGGVIAEQECPTVDVAGSNLNQALSFNCTGGKSKVSVAAAKTTDQQTTGTSPVPLPPLGTTPNLPTATADLPDATATKELPHTPKNLKSTSSPNKISQKTTKSVDLAKSSSKTISSSASSAAAVSSQTQTMTNSTTEPTVQNQEMQPASCESMTLSEVDAEQVNSSTCLNPPTVEQ